MNMKLLRKTDWFVLIYGVALAVGAYAFWGAETSHSVFAGSALASVNWIVSRIVGTHLMHIGHMHLVILFFFLKTTVIVGIIFLILIFLPVQPIPFLIGLSALVFGLLSNCLTVSVDEGDKPSERNE